MLTMNEAKSLGISAAGQEFECDSGNFAGNVPNGIIGVILPEVSSRGKVQAELTCSVPGCTNTHIREKSDWHQCRFCAVHQKNKGTGGAKASVAGVAGLKGLGAVGPQVKLPDGTVLREMKADPSDSPELAELKIQNNAIYTALKARQDAERAAKADAEKAARAAKAEADKASTLKARLEAARKVAAEMGVPLSPSLIQAAKEADLI